MSAALTLLLADASGSTDHIAGVALGAALVLVLAMLARAARHWNDDEPARPGYVELRPEPAREGEPPKSIAEWRATAHASLARSRERRGNFER